MSPPRVSRVLFLPGMSGQGNFWAPVANQLPQDWDMQFLDWPGLGNVPAAADVTTFEDLVDLVASRLQDRQALVAQSMGGVIAVQTALRVPHQISHLVLCATSGGIDIAGLGGNDWRPNYERTWPDAPGWVFEAVPDLTEPLQSLEIPTLLLWATEDPVSPLAVGERLAELLPNARLITFETDEHMFAPAHANQIALEIARHVASS